MDKTISCGDLRAAHVGQSVTLAGWVHRRRDHGGVTFIDLRDRFGLVQIVVNPADYPIDSALVDPLRMEWVIQVQGVVRNRLPGAENPNMATGEIEVLAQNLVVLNAAKSLPFMI